MVPKVQVDYIFDLDDAIYQKLWRVSKKLAQALKRVTFAKRVGIAVEGFSVAHVHIHLTPLYEQSELDPHRNISWSSEDQDLFIEMMQQEL